MQFSHLKETTQGTSLNEPHSREITKVTSLKRDHSSHLTQGTMKIEIVLMGRWSLYTNGIVLNWPLGPKLYGYYGFRH